MYVDYSTQKAVIDFNRSNDKYRVDLIDYSEYNTEDDYNAGLTKFNTEIMAGNMPDILALDTQTPYRQYAAKGCSRTSIPISTRTASLTAAITSRMSFLRSK